MKQFLFAILSLAVLIACSNKTKEESESLDPQDKARELIEPQIKASLINPDSYEFSQLRLDSCFSNSKYNAGYIMLGLKVARLFKDYKEYKSDAEEAESRMTIYAPSYGYQSAHSKLKEQKYRAEMEKAQRKASDAKEKILQLIKDNKQVILDLHSDKHEFNGWLADIKYRAETAGGLKRMGEDVFFLNKDMTEITYHITEEDMKDLQTAGLEDIQYELEEELKEIKEGFEKE